jgi:phosphate transport system permease protein
MSSAPQADSANRPPALPLVVSIIPGCGAALLLIVLLLVIAGQSRGVFNLELFTSATWNPSNPYTDQFGGIAFMSGSLATSALALVLTGIPALLIGVFLAEMTSGWVDRVASWIVEFLADIPGVVLGMWGIFFLVPMIRIPASRLDPAFVGPSLLTASLLLAFVIAPVLILVSYDACRAVPRKPGTADSRWRVFWTVVAPRAWPGLIAAAGLGMTRALGEAIAVNMVCGNVPRVFPAPLQPTSTIATSIINALPEVSPRGAEFGSLFGLALILLVAILLINVFAWMMLELVRKRSERKAASPDGPPAEVIVPGTVPDASTAVQAAPEVVPVIATDFQTAPPVVPAGLDLKAQARAKSWPAVDVALAVAGALLSVATLLLFLLVLACVVYQGLASFAWRLLVDEPGPLGSSILEAIIGSCLVVGLAALLALPPSALAAIALALGGRHRLARLARMPFLCLDAAAVIMFPLVIYVLAASLGGNFTQARSTFSQALVVLALALIMMPSIVLRSQAGIMQLEGSPWAWANMVAIIRMISGAAVQAAARAMGLTVPLIILVFTGVRALPLSIYNSSASPFANEVTRAWCAALILVGLILFLHVVVRCLWPKRAPLASYYPARDDARSE